jgi:hypothetical protein
MRRQEGAIWSGRSIARYSTFPFAGLTAIPITRPQPRHRYHELLRDRGLPDALRPDEHEPFALDPCGVRAAPPQRRQLLREVEHERARIDGPALRVGAPPLRHADDGVVDFLV